MCEANRQVLHGTQSSPESSPSLFFQRPDWCRRSLRRVRCDGDVCVETGTFQTEGSNHFWQHTTEVTMEAQHLEIFGDIWRLTTINKETRFLIHTRKIRKVSQKL